MFGISPGTLAYIFKEEQEVGRGETDVNRRKIGGFAGCQYCCGARHDFSGDSNRVDFRSGFKYFLEPYFLKPSTPEQRRRGSWGRVVSGASPDLVDDVVFHPFSVVGQTGGVVRIRGRDDDRAARMVVWLGKTR